MFDISVVLITKILLVHYGADFLLQSKWMAENKSKENLPLLAHIGVYSLILLLSFGSLKFALVNGVAHFITDYITSRAGRYTWERGNVRGFFAVLGLDQLMHYIVLFMTALWYLT